MTEIAFRSAEDHAREAPRIARHLRGGGLIAYPTETVYGFGCALEPQALLALARLKQRDRGKPFLLLVLDRSHAADLAWTAAADALARAFWPGPLTLVLAVVGAAYPEGVVTNGAVAVRATPHPGVRAILGALDGPLTSTSANRPGQPPASSADQTRAILVALGAPPNTWLLDAGELPPSPPSSIVDCARGRPRLVRPGAIDLEVLRHVVKEIDA